MSTVHSTLQQNNYGLYCSVLCIIFFIWFFNLAEMDLTHATAALASLIKYLEVTLYLFLSDGKGKGAHELRSKWPELISGFHSMKHA